METVNNLLIVRLLLIPSFKSKLFASFISQSINFGILVNDGNRKDLLNDEFGNFLLSMGPGKRNTRGKRNIKQPSTN